jgi:PleD family two-component response regulator
LDAWRNELGTHWQGARASALYDELEQLAAHAGEQGARELAGPALELTVYLCSFIDRDAAPNPSQRQELERLLDRLAAAAGAATAKRAARKPTDSDESASRQVFYLRSADREIGGLTSRLEQHGCIVRSFDERDRLLLALDQATPDILLIDEAFVAEVHTLTEAVQRRRPTHKDAALCLVLAEQTDLNRTLYAQRAGADAVVTERDPIALVARLDALWAQRRALGYRVLIVEDDPGQAKFCESILRHRGMITRVCDDPAGIDAVLADFKPDLVLLDLYLPGGNGIEIAEHIRAQANHAFLPIVFLSGEQDLDLRFDAIRVGADDFITKPVKPRHLVTTVESRIRRARALHASKPEAMGERRGTFSSRDVLAHEVIRAAREEQDRCPALALLVVDEAEQILRSIGFVAGGVLPQQVGAALAAELSGVRTLCAFGELGFLVLLHGEDELGVRARLEDLRRKLDARQWLAEDAPLKLSFSLGCVRLPAELAQVEDALERARALCRNAQQAGGGRCEFDLRTVSLDSDETPQRRLVRAILRSPSIRGTAQFEFQPLVPLAGHFAGQYEVRMALAPPKSTHALRLTRADYLPVARELNMLAHADRHALRGVIKLIRERNAVERELRLFVPISVATLFDPAFAPWLVAELRAQGVPHGAITLQLSASEARSELARLHSILDNLQRIGVRLALDFGSSIEGVERMLAVEEFRIVRFARPVVDGKPDKVWETIAAPLAQARFLGKITVACAIAGMADLAILLKLGVHYVQGDALSGWLPDWTFDFAEAVL